MSKIKNGGLDQYGAKPFEQQEFWTAGIKGANGSISLTHTDDVLGGPLFIRTQCNWRGSD